MNKDFSQPPTSNDMSADMRGSGSGLSSEMSLPDEEFVQLFTQHQRRIYLFILAQHPVPNDAEEMLQNTNVVILKKFSQFERGSSFFAWAAQIARYEVLKYRERRHRDKLTFSEQFVSQIADDAFDEADSLDARRQALSECLQTLRAKDRELIQQRYAPGVQAKDVASRMSRPANSVYQSLSRIRRVLQECINRRLQAEGEV